MGVEQVTELNTTVAGRNAKRHPNLPKLSDLTWIEEWRKYLIPKIKKIEEIEYQGVEDHKKELKRLQHEVSVLPEALDKFKPVGKVNPYSIPDDALRQILEGDNMFVYGQNEEV